MSYMNKTVFSVLFLFAFYNQSSWADTLVLKDIEVKGGGLDVANGAFTVNTIDANTLQNIHLDAPLRFVDQVPGISLGDYRQGGIADYITIRGFNAAGHGGDGAMFVDGIPLNESMSHADGYADPNVLIPLEIQRIDVFKGPVSPLYGNFARGGAIAFTTRKGGEYADVDFDLGPWATYDSQAALGGAFGGLKTNIALESYHTRGWRQNSGYDKDNATARFSYGLTENSEISFSLREHGGRWDAPGYEPESQFNDDATRKLQAVNAENDGGDKRFTTGRLDYNLLLSEDTKLLVYSYSTQMDWTRWAKFGYDPGGQREDDYDRPVLGFGTSLNSKMALAGFPANWVVGLDYYHEDTAWQRWATSNRVHQSLTIDRDFVMNSASLFGQLDWSINPHFRPTLGFRYDDFSGTYENNDPGQTPFKNDMNSYNHFSPKLGLRSTLVPNWELRGSIANGFQLPEAEAKYDPTLNANPTEIWQYEVGLTGTPMPSIYTDVAVFIADTKNEILEDPIGSGIFRNVGKTRRDGVEVELRYATPIQYLELSGNYSWTDSEIKDNPDPTLVGKEVTNVPKNLATVNINYAPPVGWGANAEWRMVGSYPLTGDNTVSYSGFNVLNIGVSYSQQFEKNRSARWYIDINNVLNETYAEAAFNGFGTNNFAPAPPANLTAGVALKF